ncbi:prolipoprotein diacylglyceryl transferase [Corynebacterium kutscheri]|uniref:Phosphatidylglycerol--prolipoprotein diacylglyceryl transferase n=1 Tax=Corynebacterium kutscheri TaxID=35755 RepID=A0A0F6R0V1_9CORY|nr:prolipoprotein diacylglyceryl transferase [Corynebacterium kutscheri]AKE41510.1 prolipoprotein diacylglyceryl transferase [Corynebacterium kutscheri]VEH08788.1 prolipoprotein diacylglyceryl transferase [Corynebacterium kutscheri]VEH09834.1 prolipoprotein diacylglyceryl transferase [Corynebacterium kutscheri]
MNVSSFASFPSPPQGVWQVGPIPLRAYALCIIVGIIVALWIGSYRYAARGGNKDVVMDAAIVAIPAGIIGGRLYHVLTDHQKYFCTECSLLDIFAITKGGLGIWGAVILGTISVWGYLRYKRIPFAPFADSLAPAVVLAQAIGRLGNWFNQELYGAETSVPWALEIYYRVDEAGNYAPLTGHSTGEVIAQVHPTFLYEMIANILIFFILIYVDRVKNLGHGRVFSLYVALYCAGRFIVENLRTDEATMVFGMRINVIVSAVVCITAFVVFFSLKKGTRNFRGSSR